MKTYDPVRLYYHEVSLFPLLSPNEEYDLARRVREGDKEARDRLINSNLRMAVKYALKYKSCGIPLQDLIQTASLGLIHAVDKFDYRRGYKFSTYATYWIREYLIRSIYNESDLIRISVHRRDLIRLIGKTSQELFQELGRDPSVSELALRLNMSEKKVLEALASAHADTCLDTPVNEDGETKYGDFIPDDHAVSPEDEAVRNVMNIQLADILKTTLNRRQYEVVTRHYGIGCERMTFSELGERLHVSRERVRQIEADAFKKLRSPLVREEFGYAG